MYLYRYLYFKIQNSLGMELNQGRELLHSTLSTSVLFNFFFLTMGTFNKSVDDTFKTTECVKHSMSSWEPTGWTLFHLGVVQSKFARAISLLLHTSHHPHFNKPCVPCARRIFVLAFFKHGHELMNLPNGTCYSRRENVNFLMPEGVQLKYARTAGLCQRTPADEDLLVAVQEGPSLCPTGHRHEGRRVFRARVTSLQNILTSPSRVAPRPILHYNLISMVF